MSGAFFEQTPNFNCYASLLNEPIEELFGSWRSEDEVIDLAKPIKQLDLESKRVLTGEDQIFQTVALDEGGEITDPSGLIREVMELLFSANESTDVTRIYQVLGLLRLLRSRVKLTRPRFFISHRSVDAPYALALGHIVGSKGVSYWIDVLDPSLSSIVGLPNSVQKAIATAIIVEIALLNCSHVLAVMTSSTAGSWWVPYEYGRIRERPINSSNAAAWFHSSFVSTLPSSSSGLIVIPEYLYLGGQLRSRSEIDDWLDDEISRWSPRP